MKKLRLFTGTLLFFAVASIAALNVHLTYNTERSSGLTLHNVEALAQSENGEGECIGEGSVLCPDGKKYRSSVYRIRYQ